MLSAISSSDPDGDMLTYAWSQTAGPAIAIADPSQSELSLAMPETDTDQTVQFSVTVSDGALDDSATIDLTLANIELTPTNTQFSSETLTGTNGIVAPRDLKARGSSGRIDPFCDSPNIAVDEIDVLGENASGQGVIGTWPQSGTNVSEETIADMQSSDGGFLVNAPYPSSAFCGDPFGGGIFSRLIINDEVLVHYPDGNVYQRGVTAAVDNQPDICAAHGVFDTDINRLHYLSARSNGGLEARRITIDGSGQFSFGPETILLSDGDFCRFWVEGRQSYSSGTRARTNLFAVDQTTRELVTFRSDDVDVLVSMTEIERISLPDSGGATSEIVAAEFFSPQSLRGERRTVYVAVIVSDGQHRGTHRLLVYKNEIADSALNPSDYQGFELKTDITLSAGVPKSLSLADRTIAIISDTVPYVEVLNCDLLNNDGSCDLSSVSYLETGFDIADVVATDREIVITKPDDGLIQAFIR